MKSKTSQKLDKVIEIILSFGYLIIFFLLTDAYPSKIQFALFFVTLVFGALLYKYLDRQLPKEKIVSFSDALEHLKETDKTYTDGTVFVDKHSFVKTFEVNKEEYIFYFDKDNNFCWKEKGLFLHERRDFKMIVYTVGLIAVILSVINIIFAIT